MATDSDLINRALVRLNKLPAGQNASSSQSATMTNILAVVLNSLAKEGTIDYIYTSEMPVEDEDFIVTLMAWQARFDFGVSQERINNLAGAVGEAMRALYTHHQAPYDGEPTEAAYY